MLKTVFYNSLPQHNLGIYRIICIAWRYYSIPYITTCELKQIKIDSLHKQGFCKNVSLFENYTDVKTLSTISDVQNEWCSQFEKHRIPEPELSIRYIIEHVLGIRKAYEYELNLSNPVTEKQKTEIAKLCECRLARMPVQYIIKEWDFRDLQLTMRPPVFIPRPETEQFVDIILESMPHNGSFIEVGCGSGAISLSLIKALPQTQAIALDQSKMACELTLNNSRLNGLTENIQVIQSKLKEDGSLSEPLPLKEEQVDVIVSNPPYVPLAQMMKLEPEIKLYEDLRALEAGRDGLRVIKSIFLLAQTVLKIEGLIFLEVDSTHPKLIEQWLINHPELNLKFVKSVKDYCDRDRFVLIKKIGI